jgi:hypothetical protein
MLQPWPVDPRVRVVTTGKLGWRREGQLSSLSPESRLFVARLNVHTGRGGTLKYALLIYGTPEVRELPEDQLRAVIGEYDAISGAPGVRGGLQLQGTETATTVRVQDGEALLSDGPFVDAKEYLGGIFVFEADDLDAATALAASIPAARMGGAVEVRPVLER